MALSDNRTVVLVWIKEQKNGEKEIIRSLLIISVIIIKMQTIKIKNSQLKLVSDWLSGELAVKEARSRNRFLHLLAPRLKETDEERNKIILNKCDKGEDGKPLVEEKDGNQSYKFSGDNWATVQQEIVDLLNEDFVVEVTPSNEEDIKIVKDLIINLDKKFDPQQTEIYEIIVKQFEALDFA